MLTIDKVDDCAEMKDTKKAFEVLLFTEVINQNIKFNFN
jgi:hypothetical protein